MSGAAMRSSVLRSRADSRSEPISSRESGQRTAAPCDDEISDEAKQQPPEMGGAA
jgi:hypothetical protein